MMPIQAGDVPATYADLVENLATPIQEGICRLVFGLFPNWKWRIDNILLDKSFIFAVNTCVAKKKSMFYQNNF